MFYKDFDDLQTVWLEHERICLNMEPVPTWWQYKEERRLECEHAERQPMKWQQRNNVWRVSLFCTACGDKYDIGIKVADYDMDSLQVASEPYIKELVRELHNEISEKVLAARPDSLARQREEWFRLHTEYLKSDKWDCKRRAVLKRDKWLCQACLSREATEVHHLTYDHWSDEPLFDLVAVCAPCHNKITTMDRTRRGES